MNTEPFVIQPDNYPQALSVLGVQVTVLASNQQTRGYEITLQLGPEGAGPPPHAHDWDESFYVLSGQVELNVGGRVHACGAGALVHLPAGTMHGYQFGEGGGAMCEIAGSGSRATQLFTAMNREVPPGPPDVPQVTALLERHGVALSLR